MMKTGINTPRQWTRIREWWHQAQERDSRPRHDMKVIISPDKIEAGQKGTWTLTCKVRKNIIPAGAHIGILCPADWVASQGCPAHPIIPIADLSAKIGYGAFVTAVASNPKCNLEVGISEDIFYTIVDIVVLGSGLVFGDTINVVLGDPESCFLRAQRRAQKAFFEVGVDVKGDGEYARVEKCPILDVIGGFSSSLVVTSRPVQLCGQSFELRVAAMDTYGNICEGYDGEIEFQSTDPKANLPESYRFGSKNSGKECFSNISLNTAGFHTILALDKGSAIIGRSNPILVEGSPSKSQGKYNEYQIYFGDIHVHTMLSDGYGTPEETYTWAKEVKNLDFCAVSDHGEGAFRCSTDELWRKTCEAADKYYKTGKFVTFRGYEWGSWNNFGDKCVYYRGKEGNCWPYKPLSDTPEKLWGLLKAGEAITIPHHTKLGGLTDWNRHDDKFQTVAEIYSLWGYSEKDGPHSVQSALSRGRKLGFVAGTDNHFGLPAHGQYHPEQGALTAVMARELTREAIFDALLSRRCYATTGKRILLYVDINGHQIGEEFILNNRNAKRRILVEVAGTVPLERIELIKNNKEIYTHHGHSSIENFTYVDESSINDIDYYYIRVTQRNGHMAWSSPIWVKAFA